MTDEQTRRWDKVTETLVRAFPPGGGSVVIDGADGHTGMVADRIAATLLALGRPCVRLTDATPLADEDAWRAPARPRKRSPSPTDPAGAPTRPLADGMR